MQQDEKKQIYIGPTIQHIQNCQFLTKNQNNLLLLNKRQVLLLNLESQSIVTSKIDSEKVSSTTLHQLLNIYLIKTQSDIFAINELGQSLGKIFFKDQIALMESRFIFILPMQNGQCQDPHQRIDKLIYITDENLHISNIKVTFQRAMLKNKRITNFSFELIKKQGKNNQIDPTIVFDAPEWIQKCKIFRNLGYFVCYNKNEIMVFKLPKLTNQTIELYLTYRKTSKTQNLITDVVISQRQKQIIFGHESGAIKIYRFNETRKYLQELRGHQKKCHSLIISEKNNNDILYSSGEDNMIRIWNLYQFEEIYSLRIDLICDQIILLSDELAFVKFYDMRKTCLCKINAYKMEPIMTENKDSKINSLKCDGQWGIALYSNNYAQMFLINHDQKHIDEVDPMQEINGKKPKHYIQKIQFPLKYGNVRSAKKLRKNQYAIILQKGFSMIILDKDEIVSQNFELKKLVYNQEIAHLQQSDSEIDESDIDEMFDVHQEKSQIENNEISTKNIQVPKQPHKDDRLVELIHEKLLGTYLFGTLQDWKGIPTAINVTFVTFVTGKVVPMWDMDQKKKNIQKNTNEKEPQPRNRKKSLIPDEMHVQVEEMIHVVLGTDRGVIYIVDIQNRTQFQSRIVVHTQQIEYVKEFFPQKIGTLSKNSTNDEIFFMSLDRNRQFCFWSISQSHPPNIYCRVTNNRQISHISLHESFLLIGEKQGKISILEIVYEQEKSYKQDDFLAPPSPLRRKKQSSRELNVVSSSKLYFKVSKNNNIDGHMKKVTTGDCINYKNKNLFLTGSQDCIIKMWLGLEKILLFELKIFETIEHMRFIHNGIDFLMAHNNQISIIRSQNIDEIKLVDSQLETKYSILPYFGFQTLSIRSFFMKENEQFQSSLGKSSGFRLKAKYSLKTDMKSPLLDDLSSHKTSFGGFGSNSRMKINLNLNTKIEEQLKKTQPEQRQGQFLTKLQEKQPEIEKYHSPEKKIITQHEQQRKMKIYAKSEEKISKKKSFHIASTAQSKQYNEAYFMLPKIASKNSGGNFGKSKVSTSFQISSFLDELKTTRQKAYSYFGRYSKK